MTRRLLYTLLLAAGAAAGGYGLYALTRPPAPGPPPAAPPVAPAWVFEAPDRGGVAAAPLVTDGAVYLAAYAARGFRLAGAVHALDPATGRARWRFDDGGAMLATASAPALAGGRLYFGEGMHANFDCHLYCLDAGTGAKLWTVPTGDHIEAGPRTDGDTVYFAAGNEGVYAVDAATGARRWNYQHDVHVDTTPCRVGDVLVFGTGPSRRYKTTKVIAVAARDGTHRWDYPTRLPAWGSPAAAGDRVIVGLGNGRLTEPARPPEQPAGGVVCLDAATGKELWTFAARDAVIQQPAVAGGRVYVGSRDGRLYALNLADGGRVFETAVGGPVMAAPAVADGRVYVASVNGHVRCLAADDGREYWHFDLGEWARAEPRIYAPVRWHAGRLYVAGEFRNDPQAAGAACLVCLDVSRPAD